MRVNPPKNKIIVAVVLSIAFLIAVSGCSGPLNGGAGKEGYGVLTINMGGGNSRSVEVPYPPANVMDQLLNEITFKSNDGFKKDPVTLKSNAPETIKLQAGTWVINVYAWLDRDNEKTPYAKSCEEVTVTIIAGETTTASIQMEVLYDKLAEGYSAWVQSSSGTTAYENLQGILDNSNNNDVFSSGGTYTIWVFADQSINPYIFSDPNTTSPDITITFKSPTANGVAISYNDVSTTPSSGPDGSLFTINSGATLILDKGITLKGVNNNSHSVVKVEGGTLIMKECSEISGNTINASGTSINGGGVIVNEGTFIMEGGVINGNTANNGGGVYVGGNFTMKGGVISGNSANHSQIAVGGGVCVKAGGTFSKSGGIIYGNNADDNLKNSVVSSSNNLKGHAVYVEGSTTGTTPTRPEMVRNTTAGERVNLNSETDGEAGGWEQ